RGAWQHPGRDRAGGKDGLAERPQGAVQGLFLVRRLRTGGRPEDRGGGGGRERAQVARPRSVHRARGPEDVPGRGTARAASGGAIQALQTAQEASRVAAAATRSSSTRASDAPCAARRRRRFSPCAASWRSSSARSTSGGRATCTTSTSTT